MAQHQHMFSGVNGGITEKACRAGGRLIYGQPFLGHEVTGEEFQVQAQFFGILSGKNTVE